MASVRQFKGPLKGPTNDILYSSDHNAVGTAPPRENANGETIDDFSCFSMKYFTSMVWVRDVFVAFVHVVGAALVLVGAVNFALEANFLKYDEVRANGSYDNGHTGWVLWCVGYSMITASNAVALVLTTIAVFGGKKSRVHVWWAEREPKDAARLLMLFVTNLLVAIYAGSCAGVHAVDLSVLKELDCGSVDRNHCAKHRVVAYQIVYGVRRFATPDMGIPATGDFMGAQMMLFVIFSVKLLHSVFFAWFFTHEKPLYCFPFCFHRSLCGMFGRRCGREETEAETERAEADPDAGHTKQVNSDEPADFVADPDNNVNVPRIITCGGVFSDKLTNHLGAVRNHYHLGHLLFWLGFLIIVVQQTDPATRGYVPYKHTRDKTNPARNLLPPYMISNANPETPCAHVHTTEWIRDRVTQTKFGAGYEDGDAASIAATLATFDNVMGEAGPDRQVYDFKPEQITFSSPSIYALQDPRFFWPYEGATPTGSLLERSHPYENPFSNWPGQLVHGHVGATQATRPALTHKSGNAGANTTYRMLTLNQLQGAALKYRRLSWAADTGNGEPYGRVSAMGVTEGFGNQNDPRGTWPDGLIGAREAFANPLGWHYGHEVKGSDGKDNWKYTKIEAWASPGVALDELPSLKSTDSTANFMTRLKEVQYAGLPGQFATTADGRLGLRTALDPATGEVSTSAKVYLSSGALGTNECVTLDAVGAAPSGSDAGAFTSHSICSSETAPNVGLLCLQLGYGRASVSGYCTGNALLVITNSDGTLKILPDVQEVRPTASEIEINMANWGPDAGTAATSYVHDAHVPPMTTDDFYTAAVASASSAATSLTKDGSQFTAFLVNSKEPYSTFKTKRDAIKNPKCVWPGGLGADGEPIHGCTSSTAFATPIYKCGITRDSPVKMTETSDTGEALMLSSRLFLIGAIVGLLASLAMALGHVGYGISAVPADFPTNTHVCQLNPC